MLQPIQWLVQAHWLQIQFHQQASLVHSSLSGLQSPRLNFYHSICSKSTKCSSWELTQLPYLPVYKSTFYNLKIGPENKSCYQQLKQFAIQVGCFTLSFSPYRVPLLDLTLESFRVFRFSLQLSQKFSVAWLGSQVPKLTVVALMKFLVAPGKGAAVNVECWNYSLNVFWSFFPWAKKEKQRHMNNYH